MTKIQGSKKTIISLSLILILAMTLMTAFCQTASAQAGIPQPEKTVGYITVAPTLVGVGQTLTCNAWVFPLPTTYTYTPYFQGWFGVTVTFVRPDGTKDTFMPVDGTGQYVAGEMSSLGSMFFFYEPNQAGNWSVSFTMPAQNITTSAGTVQYLGCTSRTFYFDVQTDIVLAGLLNGYPWAPLPDPNVFWSYPINTNNREWASIASDWTGISSTNPIVRSTTCMRWQPYGTGPNTGHIVWYQRVKEGGIIGGDYGSVSYVGDSTRYAAILSFPKVMAGMVFINLLNTAPVNYRSGVSNTPENINNPGQFRAIDLATGKILYQANGTISGGIHLPGTSYQQATIDPSVLLESSYGSYQQPYLFGRASVDGVEYWNYYDPLTGNLVRQISNATRCRLIDGTVLAFGSTGALGVFRWNMTSVTGNDWPTGITWSAPLPTSIYGTSGSYFGVTSDASVVVLRAGGEFWGYNAETGAQIWHTTLNYPVTGNQEFQLANVDYLVVFDSYASTFKAYSMETGAFLWESDSFNDANPWATTWTIYYTETNDLDNMYIAFPDGTARAYSLADGHEVWRSEAFASTEFANNAVPFIHGGCVLVDGKLYEWAGYSIGYLIDPIPRFAMLVCIDATTGDIIYTLNGGVAPQAAANGYLLGAGVFDGNLYCLGKGPTSTSVTIQNDVIANGATVLIKGSVLDMSPATQEYASQVRFPNGVPAVADADMSEWMDYLYMQNATLLNDPPIPDGVTVSVSALDSNGGYTDLGTATSNYAGQFALSWTPTSEGIYQIFASFAGSESYYGSYAGTALSVGPAPTTPTNGGTGTETAPDNTMLLYGILVAVVIAIVLALIAIIAIFMKR